MTRWLRAAAVGLAVLALSACGPSESDQRQAFITFLQTEVLPKPGVRLPKLDEETKAKVGDYEKLYAVITRFHDEMNDTVAKPMQEAMGRGVPRTLEDIVNRRTDLATVRESFAKMRVALDKTEEAAKTRRAALETPGDLARVYDAAFDKLVTKPAATFREVFPTLDATLTSMVSLGGLIDANRSKVKLTGQQIEIADATVRAAVVGALSDLAAKKEAIDAAQAKFRATMTGR